MNTPQNTKIHDDLRVVNLVSRSSRLKKTSLGTDLAVASA